MENQGQQSTDKLQRELEHSQRQETSRAPDFPSEGPPAYEDTLPGVAPTVTNPFNFPSDAPLPSYSALVGQSSSGGGSSSGQGVIAIPQSRPDAASPFVKAYPPILLSHGVTEEAWHGFLDTLSGFLSAKVGDRALGHAGDMARHMSEHPKNVGKELYSHSKNLGQTIVGRAQRGNVIGAAAGVIRGVVGIPIRAAFGVVSTVVTAPGNAVGAIAKKPRTPYERALTYVFVANEKWLVARGLQASLADTNGLAQIAGVDAAALLGAAGSAPGDQADLSLRALSNYIAPVKVSPDEVFDLGEKTLWLVLLPVDPRQLPSDGKS